MQPRLLRSPARLAGASLLRLQSDERLVALARDGHEQAFAAIVERYRAPLERYAARVAGTERGEDAVQQAFVNAHRALVAHPERAVELRPWLYRIVHNASLNQLRSARDDAPLDDAIGAAALSEDAVDRRERLREALDAVAALPPVQRDAILLRELEGRSHEEIAAALGVTKGAARQHLFRARGALRAAATAITPQPLLERLLFAASGSGATDAVAAGGLGALAAKATAGLLATGALVGGAVGSGVVHAPGRGTEHHAATTTQAEPAAGVVHGPLLAGAAARGAAAADVADGALGSGSAPSGEATHHRRGHLRHGGSGSSSDGGGSRHGSSGPSGSRGGSGQDGSGDGSHSGSGSGGDGGHSGTTSHSGDGSSSGGATSSGSGDGGHSGSDSSGGSGDSGGTSGSGSDGAGRTGSVTSSGGDGGQTTSSPDSGSGSGSGSGDGSGGDGGSRTTTTLSTDGGSGSGSSGGGSDG